PLEFAFSIHSHNINDCLAWRDFTSSENDPTDPLQRLTDPPHLVPGLTGLKDCFRKIHMDPRF
ncbi:hypothetical protein NPIL_683671, partial [Nephila pilipes]